MFSVNDLENCCNLDEWQTKLFQGFAKKCTHKIDEKWEFMRQWNYGTWLFDRGELCFLLHQFYRSALLSSVSYCWRGTPALYIMNWIMPNIRCIRLGECAARCLLFSVNFFLGNTSYNTDISATAMYLTVKTALIEVNFEKRICSLSLC